MAILCPVIQPLWGFTSKCFRFRKCFRYSCCLAFLRFAEHSSQKVCRLHRGVKVIPHSQVLRAGSGFVASEIAWNSEGFIRAKGAQKSPWNSLQGALPDQQA